MAVDAFLKIEGIPGESSDERHKDWIEVTSFSHGVAQELDRWDAGSSLRGRCHHEPLVVTKSIDKATPKLHEACCTHKLLKQVALELCRAAGEKQKYMEIKLHNAVIGSVRLKSGSQGAGGLPVEELTFHYRKIDWTYTETDHKTGKPKGEISASSEIGEHA